MSHPYPEVFSKLSPFQRGIYNQCVNKRSGGLSVPMGTGKTFISLLFGTYLSSLTDSLTLIVCSKSLIPNWVSEIKKFFGDTLKYEILHKSYIKDMSQWVPKSDTKVVITTTDMAAKYYTEFDMSSYFIDTEQVSDIVFINHFVSPKDTPYLNHKNGAGLLFSIRWGTLIIDEIQNHNNIGTTKCRGISSICAHNKWGLSGSMFSNPSFERLLGYYVLLGLCDKYIFPDNIPAVRNMMKNGVFRGYGSTLVQRRNNVMFIPPKTNHIIVSNKMTPEEERVYLTVRMVIAQLNVKMRQYKLLQNNERYRQFSAYILASITYLRQTLVSPIVPLTSAIINISDLSKKSELAKVLMKAIESQHLTEWMNKPESIKSTRINKILETVAKHTNDRIVLFASHRTSIDLIKHFIIDRPVFTISSNMSMATRERTQSLFEKSDNGILLLTYSIGSVGLNLQCASIVMLADFWWDGATTKQSIARVLRYGQLSSVINVYYFTSNTAIENLLFKKQISKIMTANELAVGKASTKIPKMNMKDIIKLIEMDDNLGKINEIIEI